MPSSTITAYPGLLNLLKNVYGVIDADHVSLSDIIATDYISGSTAAQTTIFTDLIFHLGSYKDHPLREASSLILDFSVKLRFYSRPVNPRDVLIFLLSLANNLLKTHTEYLKDFKESKSKPAENNNTCSYYLPSQIDTQEKEMKTVTTLSDLQSLCNEIKDSKYTEIKTNNDLSETVHSWFETAKDIEQKLKATGFRCGCNGNLLSHEYKQAIEGALETVTNANSAERRLHIKNLYLILSIILFSSMLSAIFLLFFPVLKAVFILCGLSVFMILYQIYSIHSLQKNVAEIVRLSRFDNYDYVKSAQYELTFNKTFLSCVFFMMCAVGIKYFTADSGALVFKAIIVTFTIAQCLLLFFALFNCIKGQKLKKEEEDKIISKPAISFFWIFSAVFFVYFNLFNLNLISYIPIGIVVIMICTGILSASLFLIDWAMTDGRYAKEKDIEREIKSTVNNSA